MSNVVRCKECCKSWEFTETKTHICICGHRMDIKVSKNKKDEGITSIPTNQRYIGLGIGRINHHRTNDSWNYNWQPNVQRKSSQNVSSINNSLAFYERKKQLWEELEELINWEKEGLKIKNGTVEELEKQLRRLKRF